MKLSKIDHGNGINIEKGSVERFNSYEIDESVTSFLRIKASGESKWNLCKKILKWTSITSLVLFGIIFLIITAEQKLEWVTFAICSTLLYIVCTVILLYIWKVHINHARWKKVIETFCYFVLLILVLFPIYFVIIPRNSSTDFCTNYNCITNQWVVFHPPESYNYTTTKGIIFYSGLLKEPVTYAPLLSQLAKRGFFIVAPRHPLLIPLFDPNLATTAYKAFSSYASTWYMGGHDQGGTAAGIYIEKNQDDIKGLFLFASYITSDLSKWNGTVCCMYGQNDRIVSWDSIQANKNNLPHQYPHISLSGFNHASFGGYDLLPWDWEKIFDGESTCGSNCFSEIFNSTTFFNN